MIWRALLFGLVFVSPPFLKAWLLRSLGGARIGRGARIGWFAAVSARRITLGEHAVIRPFSLIRLDGDLALGAYSEVSSFTLIYGSADFTLGAESYIGPQCLINVEAPVRIGTGSALGPRSMVFTHGSFLPYTDGYWVRLAGVTVGDQVWCAAGVFLHPGVEIGDNSFVNSRAVVTQPIPAGSVAEGNPARVVYPMARVQRKMTPRHVDVALERVLADFCEISLRRELGVQTVTAHPRSLSFTWRGRAYWVALVSSAGQVPEAGRDGPRQAIYLNNAPGWAAPDGAWTLDVTSRTTRFVSDPVHTALRLFLLRYFGLRLREAGGSTQ
jgi:acetyltransferase-like isoleucine patch superfamily enzyme